MKKASEHYNSTQNWILTFEISLLFLDFLVSWEAFWINLLVNFEQHLSFVTHEQRVRRVVWILRFENNQQSLRCPLPSSSTEYNKRQTNTQHSYLEFSCRGVSAGASQPVPSVQFRTWIKDYDRVVESRQTEEEEKVLKSKLGVGESINKVEQLWYFWQKFEGLTVISSPWG